MSHPTIRPARPSNPRPQPIRCKCGDLILLVGGTRPFVCPSCIRWTTALAGKGGRR